MNCLTCRRLLLSAPREQSTEQREHLASCRACARLEDELAALEPKLDEAALVAVPDALAERVLLAHRGRRVWRFAVAALVVLAIGLSGLMLPSILDFATARATIEAVGPAHPAVAAIALVMDDRAELPQSGNDAEMAQEMKRLGLTLNDHAYAYYLGKCSLPGSDCDLITVSTQDVSANVVLVPDYPEAARMLVSDRRMTALVSPAKSGAYIVVADSPAVARRIAKVIGRS